MAVLTLSRLIEVLAIAGVVAYNALQGGHSSTSGRERCFPLTYRKSPEELRRAEIARLLKGPHFEKATPLIERELWNPAHGTSIHEFFAELSRRRGDFGAAIRDYLRLQKQFYGKWDPGKDVLVSVFELALVHGQPDDADPFARMILNWPMSRFSTGHPLFIPSDAATVESRLAFACLMVNLYLHSYSNDPRQILFAERALELRPLDPVVRGHFALAHLEAADKDLQRKGLRLLAELRHSGHENAWMGEAIRIVTGEVIDEVPVAIPKVREHVAIQGGESQGRRTLIAVIGEFFRKRGN